MKDLEDYLFLLKSIKFEQDSLIEKNNSLQKEFINNQAPLLKKLKEISDLFYLHKDGFISKVLSILNWKFSLIKLDFGVFDVELTSEPIDYQLVADYIPSRILYVDGNTVIVNSAETNKCYFVWSFKSLYSFINAKKQKELKISNLEEVKEKIYQYNLITESNCKF